MSAVVMDSFINRHRITVDEYYRMAEMGMFGPDARVELIEGEIIDMPRPGSPHASKVDYLNQVLVPIVATRAIVRVQSSIQLSLFSQPQPDLALLKIRRDFYEHWHPGSPHTMLAIEVSDTSFTYDRNVKVPLYARHEIPEVWIVDVRNKQLHVFRTPKGGEYQESSAFSPPIMMTIAALPELEIDLSELFVEHEPDQSTTSL